MKELGKEAAEGQAKQAKMDRAIKELKEAKSKKEGAVKASEEKYKAQQIS
jgi:hypothetical protein